MIPKCVDFQPQTRIIVSNTLFFKHHEFWLYSLHDGWPLSWFTWGLLTHTYEIIPCPFLAPIQHSMMHMFSVKVLSQLHLMPEEPWNSRVYIHRREIKVNQIQSLTQYYLTMGLFPQRQISKEKQNTLILGPCLRSEADFYWKRGTACWDKNSQLKSYFWK